MAFFLLFAHWCACLFLLRCHFALLLPYFSMMGGPGVDPISHMGLGMN